MLTRADHFSEHPIVTKLKLSRAYFHRTVCALGDADSSFKPGPGMLSPTGHVVHVAMSLELFTAALFGPFEGGMAGYSKREKGLWDMNWTTHSGDVLDDVGDDELMRHMSPAFVELLVKGNLSLSLSLFDAAIDIVIEKFGALDPGDLMRRRIDPNPLWPEWFTFSDVLDVMLDHTAHHRGILSMYARLLGRDPYIPYFDLTAARERAKRGIAAGAASQADANVTAPALDARGRVLDGAP